MSDNAEDAASDTEDLRRSLNKLNLSDDMNVRRSERIKNRTQKSKEYVLEQLNAEKERLLRKINRRKKTIDDMMYSPMNEVAVKEELAQVGYLFVLLQDVHNKRMKEEICLAEEEWFDNVDEDMCCFKHKVHSWLQEASKRNEEELASRARSRSKSKYSSSKASSRSRCSSKTYASSRSDKNLQEKMKLAELEAEACFRKRKTEMKLKTEQLEFEEKLAKMKARVSILEPDLESEYNRTHQGNNKDYEMSRNDVHAEPIATHPTLTTSKVEEQKEAISFTTKELKHTSNYSAATFDDIDDHKSCYANKKPSANAATFQTTSTNQVNNKSRNSAPERLTKYKNDADRNTPNYHYDNEGNLQEKLCSLVKQQSAPDIVIDTFEGNPMEFDYFISVFKEVVESKIDDQMGRLIRLLKFTDGEAKQLIKHCVHHSRQSCYNDAIQLLQRHYGDPHRILAAYRNEIKHVQVIKQSDASAFRSLYSLLLKCDGLRLGLNYNPLDSPETICRILTKLPIYLQDRWNRQVLQMRKNGKKEPQLKELIHFIEDEMTMMNDPLYGRSALSEYADRKDRREPNKYQRRIGAFFAAADDDATKNNSMKRQPCSMCKKNHWIENCSEYLALDVIERNKRAFKLKLCFKCLQPISVDHTAATCKSKRRCKVCSESHPTTLHGIHKEEKQKDKQEASPSNIDKREAGDITCAATCSPDYINICIVPVELTSETSNEIIQTYALLDSCSQASFIVEGVIEKLLLAGRKTSITVKTISGEENQVCEVISGIKVRKRGSNQKWLTVPKTYSRHDISMDHINLPNAAELEEWKHLKHISKEFPINEEVEIGILIGANCPQALEPYDVVHSKDGGPYAIKSKLGWCIVGPTLRHNKRRNVACNRIAVTKEPDNQIGSHHFEVKSQVKETDVKIMLENMYNADFTENSQETEGISIEDKKFLEIVEKGIKHVAGKYQVPLPFRKTDPNPPNNRFQAIKRFSYLQKKFQRDEEFQTMYVKAMTDMLNNGYAEVAPEPTNHITWYIPHHGVMNPNKAGKVRIVFDCSTEYQGFCINKELLKGPDLTSLLVGVLMRFRKEAVAITADIEAMFLQVKVPPDERDYFRFLWFEDNDVTKRLTDHRMASHVFGSTSSPSCANFALRKAAQEHGNVNSSLKDTVNRNFYVDDLLKSVKTTSHAANLALDLKELCKKGGFNLTKFNSNKKDALSKLEKHDIKNSQNLHDLLQSTEETALGMRWRIEDDYLMFKVNIQERPSTRRGILSIINSFYDPLGLVGPFILSGKIILQKLCKLKYDWDKEIPHDIQSVWLNWKNQIKGIQDIRVQRCYKPDNFGDVKNSTLHFFSDACEDGYGTVCYLRQVNIADQVYCSIVYARSRVAPLKFMTIPRMELTAATLSAKTSTLILNEIDMKIDDVFFWCDSQAVLGYIKNEARTFKIFVANRIQQIQDLTNINNWNFVKGKENPADYASRGLKTEEEAKLKTWFKGPKFLWKEDFLPEIKQIFYVEEDDEEKRKVITTNVTSTVEQESNFLADILNITNSWRKLVRITAAIKTFISKVKSRINMKNPKLQKKQQLLSNDVLKFDEATSIIIKLVQDESFQDEMQLLSSGKAVKKSSQLFKLDPFLDNGILRVGGRLKHSQMTWSEKHPIILPKNHKITEMMTAYYHQLSAHGGRNTTLNKIRQYGLWIIKGSSVVKKIISKCLICRKLFGMTSHQKMGDLPHERVSEAPPFTFTGVDMFGPFEIKERRSIVKRYAVLFTCLNSRAVHIEVAESMTTDSFILSLRRFIGRRGNVKIMRSDNGTNFVGTNNEMKCALHEIDESKISKFMSNNGVQWLKWKFNPPAASHMGGVWERQIRSARRTLAALLESNKTLLNNESFVTLMVEVESILNSRPLTVEALNDPHSPLPISPSMLLTMKSDVIFPPPGSFDTPADKYSKRQWRRVQHVANQFWYRWKKEFLTSLQPRQKWNRTKRNLIPGDIVLINDQSERNKWPMGKVDETTCDSDGNIREVMVRVSNGKVIRRPITKLVLLVENDSPPEDHVSS